MSPPPRGRNVATTVAVVLAIALALLWLRSSGESAPSVPVGLPVETVPATVAEPVDPTGLGPAGGAEAEEPSAVGAGETHGDVRRRGEGARDAGRVAARRRGERRLADRRPRRRRHADRAGGAGKDESASRLAERLTRRQDPPAAAPGPGAGSGPADTAPPAAVSPTPASPAHPAPEFALG